MDIKDRIIDKAQELFFQRGIKDVSMDELASSLGISKRTIYENFKDKEDILKVLLNKLIHERNLLYDKYIDENSNIVDIFIATIEIHRSFPIGNTKFIRDIYKYYPEIGDAMHEYARQNNKSFQSLLHQGVKDGYVRPDLNIPVTAFLAEETNYTYIRAVFIKQPPFSFDELLYTMMMNFVRGIFTEKGLKIIDEYTKNKNDETNKKVKQDK